MDIAEILKKVTDVGIPVVIIVLLGLIKIPKLEINIWKWLAKTIGNAFNVEIKTDIQGVKSDIKTLRDELDEYEEKFDAYTTEDMHMSASNKRRIILEFNDDIMSGRKFSQEHWDSVLETIDRYEKYCNEHQDFKNNKAILSIQNIKEAYKVCLREGQFL